MYNSIRVFITAYLWMTGFGNFNFFYLKVCVHQAHQPRSEGGGQSLGERDTRRREGADAFATAGTDCMNEEHFVLKTYKSLRGWALCTLLRRMWSCDLEHSNLV